jgi:hypothetical protein
MEGRRKKMPKGQEKRLNAAVQMKKGVRDSHIEDERQKG